MDYMTEMMTQLTAMTMSTSPASPVGSKLVKSDETKQIGKWKATRYDMTISMGDDPAEVTLWVSDGVDVDMSAYRAFVESVAASSGMNWMLSFLEVDGYPVRQEFRMGPLLSWQQLVSVSQELAPTGTYDPPEGFTKRD